VRLLNYELDDALSPTVTDIETECKNFLSYKFRWETNRINITSVWFKDDLFTIEGTGPNGTQFRIQVAADKRVVGYRITQTSSSQQSTWKQPVDTRIARDSGGKMLQMAGFGLTSLTLLAGLFREQLYLISFHLAIIFISVILFLIAAQILVNAINVGEYFVGETFSIIASIVLVISFIFALSAVIPFGSVIIAVGAFFVVLVSIYFYFSIRGLRRFGRKI
jgi:hypothetical protein